MNHRLAYPRVQVEESFGAHRLALEVIASLDEAMDLLCADLEARGLTRDPASFDLCPYFGAVWPSARALAGELARRGEAALAGRRVLEIGCGLAVPSLMAARLGARVTATDFHPEVPVFLAANQANNGVSLDYVPFDWRARLLSLGAYDLVLASDLLYDPAHALPVARTLARHLAPGGRVLLADPGRPYLDECLGELARLGLRRRDHVYTVPGTPQLGHGPADVDVFLIELWGADPVPVG